MFSYFEFNNHKFYYYCELVFNNIKVGKREMVKENSKKLNSSSVIQVMKGTIYSVCLSLVLILIFALFIRFVNISENMILPINQVIKIVSILTGCLICLKRTNKGFIKGFLIGIFYAILAYITFSFLSGTISFGLTSFTDILFCGIIGGLSGIIAVNISKK